MRKCCLLLYVIYILNQYTKSKVQENNHRINNIRKQSFHFKNVGRGIYIIRYTFSRKQLTNGFKTFAS